MRAALATMALLLLVSACSSSPAADSPDAASPDADSAGSASPSTDSSGTDSPSTDSANNTNGTTSTTEDPLAGIIGTDDLINPERGLGVPLRLLASLDPCARQAFCGTVAAEDGYPVRFLIIPANSRPVAGVLAVHFGGPGTNARETVQAIAPPESSQSVLGNFDLIGVEQRGTDAFDGVDCGNDALFHQLSIGVVPAADQARLAQQWISGCPAGSFGSVTATADIATVLEHLNPGRAVFLGFSYGGVIGALLGANHADVVDAIVLDSPGIGWTDPRSGLIQTRAFNASLEKSLENCDQTLSCTFAPDGNAEQRFLDIVNSYAEPGELAYATGRLLYSAASFPRLDEMLTQVQAGDTQLVTRNADSYHRRQNESYPPSTEIFPLVACSDGVFDFSQTFPQIQAELRSYGPFGELAAIGLYNQVGICEHWPGESKPFELDLSQSEVPVLLVASTNDPAAPWEYVEPFIKSSLPAQSAAVVVHDFIHTLWGNGIACIDDAVDTFLVDGTLPAVSSPDGILDCDPDNAPSS